MVSEGESEVQHDGAARKIAADPAADDDAVTIQNLLDRFGDEIGVFFGGAETPGEDILVSGVHSTLVLDDRVRREARCEGNAIRAAVCGKIGFYGAGKLHQGIPCCDANDIRLDRNSDKWDKTPCLDERNGTLYRAALIDLQAVIAVVRRGSFRAAAIDLGLSSTAFSHTIAKLEAGLGVRLFNRTTRSVSLTDAGRTFVQQIAPALQDIGDAMEAVRAQRQKPSGVLRINAANTAAREILSPLLLEFLARYPDMEIDLVTEGRLVDIVADGSI